MATAYQILGQAYPTAATQTVLYTVPAATSSVISSIVVCNQASGSTDMFRVSIAQGGASDSQKQYLYGGSLANGLAIGPNDTFSSTLGITLAATDVVRVYSVNGTCSFQIFGSQLT